jgi:selenocysteine-specific elongation factor
VTGALRRAPLAVGDEVEIWPGGLRARLRGVQIHGAAVEHAPPARRVALALRGVAVEQVPPGSALASPGLLSESRRLDAQVALLASAAGPLPRGASLRLLAGTAEVGARLHLLDRAMLAPGETAVVQLRLDAPLAMPSRERFVLRLASPARTVGGGLVLDPAPPRRSTRDAALLAAMATATPMQAAALRLQAAGARGATAEALARIAGVLPAALEVPGAVRLAGGLLLHGDACAALEAAVIAAVEAAQLRDPATAGPGLAELAAALPPGAPVPAVLARLVAARVLDLAAGRFTRRGLDPLALLPPAARRLLDATEATFRGAGLAPPDAAAVVAGQRARAQAVALLIRSGRLVRAPDAVQKREVLFHQAALAGARAALRTAFAGNDTGFLVGECGRLLGISRKFAVPLLERLDAEGVTRRSGDRRHIATEPDAGPAG